MDSEQIKGLFSILKKDLNKLKIGYNSNKTKGGKVRIIRPIPKPVSLSTYYKTDKCKL